MRAASLVARYGPMAKTTPSKSVPQNTQAIYESIVALIDSVCRDHLNVEYRELAQRMAATLCRMRPSPVASGQPRTWACGIIYELGRINFLPDPSTQPHMTTADVCSAFGVGQSTASAKARVISLALKTHPLDPRWSLPSFLDANPLVWMAEVNGILVDLREMPREVQEIAFHEGMIPYIPADRECSAQGTAIAGRRRGSLSARGSTDIDEPIPERAGAAPTHRLCSTASTGSLPARPPNGSRTSIRPRSSGPGWRRFSLRQRGVSRACGSVDQTDWRLYGPAAFAGRFCERVGA